MCDGAGSLPEVQRWTTEEGIPIPGTYVLAVDHDRVVNDLTDALEQIMRAAQHGAIGVVWVEDLCRAVLARVHRSEVPDA